MKLFLRILCFTFLGCFSLSQSKAQTCPANYTAASLNWDLMSFLAEGGTVTTAMSQNQKFAFGKNQISITHNYAAVNAIGDNANHTGSAGSNGDGFDVQFIGNGKITISFLSAVQNVKFSLYDVDFSQKVTVTAFNGTTPQPITLMEKVSGAMFTISGSGTNTASATSNTAFVANTVTDGTVNVSIAGPITSFIIDVTLSGIDCKNANNCKDDGSFWLSDISACTITEMFPVNYHQTGSNQPFIGQPDYFISTPDNNSAYMVDPATGKAWHLFTEPASTYINSFAYDPFKKILYYVTDGSSSSNVANNKRIRKYDFNTETSSDFITNVNNYGIPTFSQGIESAAACFYDGALYLGIEGGTSPKSIVWRLDIDDSGVPATKAYQVLGMPSAGHDWGDFIIKNGVLFDFNTAREGNNPNYTYTNSTYHHYNLITGTITNFVNPNFRNAYVGQAAMDWTGNIYSIRNSVQKYNEDGTLNTAIPINVVRGASWVGNAGDASEPFKPKADFGDAPASYDPDLRSPAVHEWDPNLKLGSGYDREWDKKVSTNSDGDTGDDGLPFARILNLNSGNYQTDLNVFNNTGAEAMVCAWIDFNANNTFETGEGIEVIVPTNAAMQQVSLYWPSISANLPANSYTVLRIRVTSRANGMTKSNPIGYFANGEVEDYRIIVNATTLAVRSVKFDAVKGKQEVKLQWKVEGDDKVENYNVERSSNGLDWNTIVTINSNDIGSYQTFDRSPLTGRVHYRLRIETKDGKSTYTDARIIQFDLNSASIQIISNPVKNTVALNVNAVENGTALLAVVDMNGQQLLSKHVSVQKGVNQHALPIDRLSSGQYILIFTQNGFKVQKPFLVIN